MKESQAQIIFSHYARKCEETAVYELKVAKNEVFHLSQMEEHQLDFLFSAKNGTAYHKISDAGAISALPCDCFTFHKTSAYVVIFYKEFFALIDIERVMGHKTLGIVTAKQLAAKVVYY